MHGLSVGGGTPLPERNFLNRSKSIALTDKFSAFGAQKMLSF